MRILFTVCGRAGSKGIKNKNIRDFLGKPLAYYTISAIDLYLKKHDDIEYDIAVNSDSDRLLELMDKNPMRPVELIVRNQSLAGDTVGKIDVISNCLSEMGKRKGIKYDIVVDLDITSPLRRVKDIDELIKVHVAQKPDVTTSVTTARRNPYFNQVKKVNKGVKKVIDSNYTARQQAPEIFDMNASLYAYSPEFLKSGKGVLDGYCEAIEMFDTAVLDLDHENDFELMEVIAEYLFEKYEDFKEIRYNIR
ncbi:CMP-N,N'-diacetyllegionaminic acid synthase [Anaerovibrio lipolyticus DSM 3074]|uniref:CMP-N,N'-diacetyllegionaminic acid synthase n=1 Tax=Anaerovibrio lipolyticus DSM 3074 TaxID=1120997 RepID=A0A1M6FF70_9FIRM|nr:acylneuraminate cytidylyltransferase family protein [Anaerovibrio lipolyticus]SHI96272.1 CMP-N,N'-diacetyllegionaminic acid synthase [Anaerovibrio lipolyticus DSM 3074]